MRRLALLVLLCGSLQSLAQQGSYQCLRKLGTVSGLTTWRYENGPTDGGTLQGRVPDYLERGGFAERWGSFLNSRFNAQPGLTAEENMLVPVVRYVLGAHRPWKDVFVGRLTVSGPYGFPVVSEDPSLPPHGLFGIAAWQQRYVGNASDGAMLQASYRILRATAGLDLTPSPQNASGDASHQGRQRAECRTCHFDSPYALDHVAALLPWRKGGTPLRTEVVAQRPTPQVLFGGKTFQSLDEVLAYITDSDAFYFWSCRLAFEFTLGRPEVGCEAPLFDRCVDTLKATQDIRQAMSVIMQEPAYCSELW